MIEHIVPKKLELWDPSMKITVGDLRRILEHCDENTEVMLMLQEKEWQLTGFLTNMLHMDSSKKDHPGYTVLTTISFPEIYIDPVEVDS